MTTRTLPCLSSLLVIACVLFASALFSVPASAEEPAVTRDDAVSIATASLPGGTLEGVRLYVTPEAVTEGSVVSSWKRDIFTAPADGWFVFVDLMPAANWEHPCLYLFVDEATGDVQSFESRVPPRHRDAMTEVTNGRDNPPPGVSERELAAFSARLQELPKPPRETRGMSYALIISGGADQGNNHIRYWNDCAFIYRTLAGYYEYPDENIYVCISDGTNPAVDRSDGTNSPVDLDNDGDADIMYPATMQYITQVFNELATILTPSDQLFIFTTDHGGQESGWDAYLNLWNWEEMRDDQMAALVSTLPCETVICTFEQCFSGGMLDDLVGEGRVISTGASYTEYSWAMPPDYVYDTYVYFWTAAVAWQLPSGAPVDADINNDMIVDMHEAFLYAQANDFSDETPQYSSTPADLGDMLNLYGNLAGVYLMREDLVIDDDLEGASSGDGDGVIDFAETIEIYVTLSNRGTETAVQVTGTLTTPSPYVSLIANGIKFGDIPPGMSATNPQPFVFYVAQDVPDGTDLEIYLELNEEPGGFGLGLSATAPEYDVYLLDIDDPLGNGNGVAEPGETVSLIFEVRNTGGCPSPDLNARLLSGDPNFTTDETPHAIGMIPVGGSVLEENFQATVALTCPPQYAGILYLELLGPNHYHAMGSASLSVGQIFSDDVEAGPDYWTHYVGPGTGWVDEWHLDTYRNHTLNGSTSWKCGGAGATAYASYNYSILETDPFTLAPGGSLNFWHWMRAETSSSYPDYCYDGGLLQISVNDGAWTTLTPTGGYPYTIRTGSTQTGPFTAGTLVWSGTIDWTEVNVDLSAYSGTAKLRWVFGSDQAVVLEGWYLDDVQVVLYAASSTPDEPVVERVLHPRLMPAYPNPMVGAEGNGAALDAAVHLRFELPAAERVRLELFDPSGRCIRTLADEDFAAGSHAIAWDGRDASGRPVGAGSYYYRMVTGDRTQAGKVMIVR